MPKGEGSREGQSSLQKESKGKVKGCRSCQTRLKKYKKNCNRLDILSGCFGEFQIPHRCPLMMSHNPDSNVVYSDPGITQAK